MLSSRMLLTNKGDDMGPSFDAKGRWIVGGHNDPDIGLFDAMSPTASLLGHNLLIMVAVQVACGCTRLD